jgi:DNA-binding GntR family transcriptional regulator
MPEISRDRPGYEQVHDYYARQIADGTLGDGALVPSVRQIEQAWTGPDGRHISRETADRALRMLASGGLVTRDRRGTVVRSGRLKPGPQARLAWTALPPAERVDVLHADYETRAPRYVWPLLGLEPVRMDGECHVVRREQVYSDAAGPFMLAVDWIHPRFLEACPELLEREPLPDPGGAARLIEARTGIALARGRESHEARVPRDDGREAPLLRLAGGERVLAQVWTWYSHADAMVYTEAVLGENRVLESEFAVSARG